MLRQHVERALEQRRRVLRADGARLERCTAFEHLEAVGRHQDRAARLVHAVVGAADPLGQPAGALRRADMDDQIDVAPVDAEVEGRGGDDGAQAVALHRLLDAPALADGERAVMQGDRQIVLVDPPELAEQHFGLAARVDEQQRRAMAPDRLVDLGDGVAGGVARPGHALFGFQDGDFGLGASGNGDQLGHGARRLLADQPAPQLVRLRNGRRQADGLQRRHKPAQPRQAERQQMAALRGHQRMQLVENHVAQAGEEPVGGRRGDQQRQLFGRGEQNVGRVDLLALPLVRRGVAGAGLDGHRQLHLADRLAEIALDVDGQRLERRDVERVDAAMRLPGPPLRPRGERGQRRQEAGQRLAGAGRRDQQHRLAGLGLRQQIDLMGARRPAALHEPFQEWLGQQGGGSLGLEADLARHASEVARRRGRAKRESEQNGIKPP